MGALGVLLEAPWGLRSSLGASWERLGSLLASSWAPLGASREPLGASWEPLGTSWEPLGASWEPLRASWEPLGDHLGGP